jgi:hypothetical protein
MSSWMGDQSIVWSLFLRSNPNASTWIQNTYPKGCAIEDGEYIRRLGYRDRQKQMTPKLQ